MFLEILQNSHENTCAAVSFLIKPQALTCNFIKKETLAQAFYCEFCEISKYTFSYGTPPLAASGQSDFQTKGLKREREKERSEEYGCQQKQYWDILHWCYQVEEAILSMFRIISTGASLDYPAGVFLRIMNFRIASDIASNFLQLSEVAVHEFSGISKKALKKNSVMKSSFIINANWRI